MVPETGVDPTLNDTAFEMAGPCAWNVSTIAVRVMLEPNCTVVGLALTEVVVPSNTCVVIGAEVEGA
jgi:hypothetical protein